MNTKVCLFLSSFIHSSYFYASILLNIVFSIQALVCLVALLGSAAASIHTPHRRVLADIYCRGEEVCLKQICNPAAYQYDLATAGLNFPYEITYTTTASSTTTTFVFMVCSTPLAHKDCKTSSPGCAPLKAVQIRMKDDQLSMGDDLFADPPGSMWPSCNPYGPGHLWDATTLGDLAVDTAKNASCTTLSVTVNSNANGKKATLSDVCQQGVVIKDNRNDTIFDQSTLPGPSCLFVLEEQNGRVAYGTVVDESSVLKESPAETTPVETTASSPAHSPQPYGPTPYSSGLRRRLMASRARAVGGRLL